MLAHSFIALSQSECCHGALRQMYHSPLGCHDSKDTHGNVLTLTIKLNIGSLFLFSCSRC